MYLLGRVIAPAIQEPHKFGIQKDPVPEGARGILHFMGQFFHIFATNESFPGAHAHAQALNDLIVAWRDPLATFWETFATSSTDASDLVPASGSNILVEVNGLATTFRKYLPAVFSTVLGVNGGGGGGGVGGGGENEELLNAFASALSLMEPDVWHMNGNGEIGST